MSDHDQGAPGLADARPMLLETRSGMDARLKSAARRLPEAETVCAAR
ncbi:hypothetical protein ABT299_22505 [Spirillospora sp. NPDC000708]